MNQSVSFDTVLAIVLGSLLMIAGPAFSEADTGERPVFCKLSTAEMRERLGAVRAELFASVVAVDELESGFRYWVKKSPEHLVMLAKFVEFESNCCGFMDFEIGLIGGQERAPLTLTGGEGTKAMLEQTMKKVSFDWRAGS